MRAQKHQKTANQQYLNVLDPNACPQCSETWWADVLFHYANNKTQAKELRKAQIPVLAAFTNHLSNSPSLVGHQSGFAKRDRSRGRTRCPVQADNSGLNPELD